MKNKRDEAKLREGDNLPFWKTIYSFAKDEFCKFALIVFMSVVTGITVAIQPLVIKYIVDNGITDFSLSDSERLKVVGIFCLIYIAVSVLRVSTWAVAYKITLKSLENIVFKIRSEFFYHVEHLCMKFHEKTSVGELYNCLMGTPIANVKSYLQQIILAIPYQGVSFAISIVALLSYDWLLTLVLLVVAFFMVLFNFLAKKRIRSISRDYIKKESETSKYITDVLQGMDAIKVYSIEENVFETFNDYVKMIRNEGVRLTYSQYQEAIKPELTTFIGTALVYFIGAFSCIYRGVSTGVLFAFISSMSIVLSTLTSWLNINLQKQSAYSGLQKIMGILNIKASTPEIPEERKRNTDIEKSKAKNSNKACIELNNVTFSYSDKPVYNGLSCSIGYNESIGLVGGSGSGKSTFTKLIMRMYDVQGGEVKIHGRNIKDFRIHDLRKMFGIVPQNPFIFQGTIMDNIRIARPDCENIDVIKAMEIAHVHEFVNELPKGWNTVIGDGGLNLSGGQKQRIAIARAVLGNPEILIFDEATSALDNISERHIQEAMEELMKSHTVIIVAHRLSTIKNVDRIMVFDNGEIAEQGAYEELAGTAGSIFSELLKSN